MNKTDVLWRSSLTLSAVAVLSCVLIPGLAPVRPTVGLVFILLAPGISLIRPLRLGDIVEVVVLGVALSVALAGALTGVMLYTGYWFPGLALVALATLCFIGVVLDIWSDASRKTLTRGESALLQFEPRHTRPAWETS